MEIFLSQSSFCLAFRCVLPFSLLQVNHRYTQIKTYGNLSFLKSVSICVHLRLKNVRFQSWRDASLTPVVASRLSRPSLCCCIREAVPCSFAISLRGVRCRMFFCERAGLRRSRIGIGRAILRSDVLFARTGVGGERYFLKRKQILTPSSETKAA